MDKQHMYEWTDRSACQNSDVDWCKVICLLFDGFNLTTAMSLYACWEYSGWISTSSISKDFPSDSSGTKMRRNYFYLKITEIAKIHSPSNLQIRLKIEKMYLCDRAVPNHVLNS